MHLPIVDPSFIYINSKPFNTINYLKFTRAAALHLPRYPSQIILKLKLSRTLFSKFELTIIESSSPPNPPLDSSIKFDRSIAAARSRGDRGHPLEADCGGSERRQWSRGSLLEVTLPNQRKNRDPSREVPRDRQFLTNVPPSFRAREKPAENATVAFHARFSSSRRHRLLLFPRPVRSFVRENLADLRDARRLPARREREGHEGGWIIIRSRRGGYLHSTYNIFEQWLQGDKVPCCSLATVLCKRTSRSDKTSRFESVWIAFSNRFSLLLRSINFFLFLSLRLI